METLEIRPAVREDAEALTALAHVSKSHWDYPGHWIAAWKEQLTFTPDFVATHAVFLVEHPDGPGLTPAACYALTQDPPEEASALELQHFWLDPGQIGRGLGRRLFDHAVAEAKTRGASALWIDADPHAEPFYLHMGAARVSATRADMDGVRRELPRMRFAIEGA